MRKQVTFVESLRKENLLKNESGRVGMGSTESNKSCMNSSQHMKNIHIPKSMMAAPFLQHPALTAGQRRYLCSIGNVYSTEHMRRQMKQHYLNLLHTCVQSGGQNPTLARRYGDPKRGEKGSLRKDAERDVEAKTKPRGQKRESSNTAHSNVIFPKIVNR